MRDIEADYRAAMVAEYKSLRSAGRETEAAHVAQALREEYGHEVEPPAAERDDKPVRQEEKPVESVKERADVPPPAENTAEPQPKRRGPVRKATPPPPPAKG